VHALSIHRPGQPPERREIGGPVRAGGSHADELHLAAWPPTALRLVPVPAGVIVEAVACGIRVGGRPVPPGGRRLLRPRERAELHGAAVELDVPQDDGTRAAAGAVLRDAAAGEAPVTGAHLVVLSGPSAGSRHPLGTQQTIGRGRAASIVLPDPHASRVHARIRLGPDGAWVEDLGSKNGVRVNGVRIERRPCAVRHGDELVIGETSVALHDVHAADVPVVHADPAGGGLRRPRLPPHLIAAALLALSAAALALAAG
jgi:FHA domain